MWSAHTHMWSTLLWLIGTKRCLTSAYHPESDGQQQRVSRVLCEMLRHYLNARHDNWDRLLPMVEFAHNIAHSAVVRSDQQHSRLYMLWQASTHPHARAQCNVVRTFLLERILG